MFLQKTVESAGQKFFRYVHQNNLVYNTCWEDPRLDRIALRIQPQDRILMITSAGCNALDYLLDRPSEIHCVDVNPNQNALLELKIAGIRKLDFEDFFQIFGRGYHPQFTKLYRDLLRTELSEPSRNIWDKKRKYFESAQSRSSFYFRGSSGFVAKVMNSYLDQLKLRPLVDLIFQSESLHEQRRIYEAAFKNRIWTPLVRWIMSSDAALSLVGVPREQRVQVEQKYPGGIAQFIEDCIEEVFTRISLKDNYFWWLYLTGSYSENRCPEYLKPHHFESLKGLVDRIHFSTTTLTSYLKSNDLQFHKYILLDHMDWLSQQGHDLLSEEWQELIDHATPQARMIWRSGGMDTDYLQNVFVEQGSKKTSVPDLFHFETELAQSLHKQDRVNTYGYFAIAQRMSAGVTKGHEFQGGILCH